MKTRGDNIHELSGIGAGTYIQSEEHSVPHNDDFPVKAGLRNREFTQNEQVYDNNADHQFNQLEMSQNFKYIREPKFFFCIPLASGFCCGLVSLQLILIIILMLDLLMQLASIIFSVNLFSQHELQIQAAAYALINGFCFIFAVINLFGICKKKLQILKFYFVWKCAEVLGVPLFEVIFILTSGEAELISSKPASVYFGLIAFKMLFRMYFAYLLYSFYIKVERGEVMLVEYGGRKLSRMIKIVNDEQMKQQWDLELTDRASSVRV